MSRFSKIFEDPPIENPELNRLFNEDMHPKKVNLARGSYKDENGKPWVLPVVRKVEQQMANDRTLNHEYLPVLGLADFSNAAVKLILGANSPAVVNNLAFGVQSLSGTGALRIGFDFLSRNGYNNLYVSNPTWGNHNLMGRTAGFTVKYYRYYNFATKSVDFEGLRQDLENAPANSVIVLHGCAHNPSGMDLNLDQWKELSDLLKRKKLFPFFDVAYQGFCSGDLDKDAAAIRLFVEEKHEIFVAQSFAKNLGLYNERVGNLTVVVNSIDLIPKMESQFTNIISANYTAPPAHGVLIALKILNEKTNFDEWQINLKSMVNRVNEMRKLLYKKLTDLSTPGEWDFLLRSKGLFSFTGLNERQCNYLIQEFHIYLLRDGRINISSLAECNIDYVAHCLNYVIINKDKIDAKI